MTTETILSKSYIKVLFVAIRRWRVPADAHWSSLNAIPVPSCTTIRNCLIFYRRSGIRRNSSRFTLRLNANLCGVDHNLCVDFDECHRHQLDTSPFSTSFVIYPRICTPRCRCSSVNLPKQEQTLATENKNDCSRRRMLIHLSHYTFPVTGSNEDPCSIRIP